MGNYREGGSWGLLASLPSLLSKLQANERPCFKTNRKASKQATINQCGTGCGSHKYVACYTPMRLCAAHIQKKLNRQQANIQPGSLLTYMGTFFFLPGRRGNGIFPEHLTGMPSDHHFQPCQQLSMYLTRVLLLLSLTLTVESFSSRHILLCHMTV